MSHELHERTKAVLDAMPPIYRDHPAEHALDALCREVQRVDDLLTGYLTYAFPQNADERFLAIWEANFGLPVAPPGQTVEQRRATVLGAVRGRHVHTGMEWSDAVTMALGSEIWDHQEISPYTVLIELPFGATSFQTGIATKIIRQITPAHLQVSYTYTGGFILGVSVLGMAL